MRPLHRPWANLRRGVRWNSVKACDDLAWTRDTSTPHRIQTNGIAERAVRRVKEGNEAMECECHLRNVHNTIANGKNSLGKAIRCLL